MSHYVCLIRRRDYSYDVGVTADIDDCVRQLATGSRLAHVEQFDDLGTALTRQAELSEFSHSKKIELAKHAWPHVKTLLRNAKSKSPELLPGSH